MYKLLIFVLAFPTVCSAQTIETDSIKNVRQLIVQNVDKILDWRDNKGRTDTMYLVRASERWRLIMKINTSGSDIISEGCNGNGHFKSTLEAQQKYTFSLGASYRGLALGIAVNPARLAGKNKDYEFNMNAYGNRLGVDVIFHSANTFHGTIETERGKLDVPTGLVRQNMLYLNTYYVFNSKRFSYPAAFSQSWMQRRSSGSFMLGSSFMGGNLRVGHSDEIGNKTTRISMANIGVGIGYGYNWVIKNKWLFHISTLPQVVVYSCQRTLINGEQEKSPYCFPNVITVGRIAVIRHFNRYFMGFTAVVNTSSTGDHSKLQLNIVKWRGRVLFGIKL